MIKKLHDKVKYEVQGNEVILFACGEKFDVYKNGHVIYDTGVILTVPKNTIALLIPSDYIFDETTLYIQTQTILSSNESIKVKAKSIINPGRKAQLGDPIAKIVFTSSVEIENGKKEGSK